MLKLSLMYLVREVDHEWVHSIKIMLQFPDFSYLNFKPKSNRGYSPDVIYELLRKAIDANS